MLLLVRTPALEMQCVLALLRTGKLSHMDVVVAVAVVLLWCLVVRKSITLVILILDAGSIDGLVLLLLLMLAKGVLAGMVEILLEIIKC